MNTYLLDLESPNWFELSGSDGVWLAIHFSRRLLVV